MQKSYQANTHRHNIQKPKQPHQTVGKLGTAPTERLRLDL
jgi:hypothetical protein